MLLIFLLQRALFSFHFISPYVICDNLLSFLIRDNQNLKFLHWASTFIGNLPVSVLHALLLQYLLTLRSHFKNLFYTNTPIQEKTGSCTEARPKGPSAFPSRRPAVKTNGCRKKFQDGASKYWSCQIDTRGKNGSLKIYRLIVNQVM